MGYTLRMARIESEKCFVYCGVVDLRKGAAGLQALIGTVEADVLYLFSNRTRGLLKFVSVDGTGVWCGTRRLHHGGFVWPESLRSREKLAAGELACLLVGGDLQKYRLRQALSGH